MPGSGAMFDRIARRYDILNRVLSFGADRRWRSRAAASLALEGAPRVLDVATGTADLAIAIARGCAGASVVGVDPSVEMLAIGRAKLAAAGLAGRVELVAGDACALPFHDDAFDGVAIAFGIRNVKDRSTALREMARVTRPGGRVVVLELCHPRDGLLAPFARFHVHRVVPAVGAWMGGDQEYRYLARSIASFPQPAEFGATMEACGLTVVGIERLGLGACALFVARKDPDHRSPDRPAP